MALDQIVLLIEIAGFFITAIFFIFTIKSNNEKLSIRFDNMIEAINRLSSAVEHHKQYIENIDKRVLKIEVENNHKRNP